MQQALGHLTALTKKNQILFHIYKTDMKSAKKYSFSITGINSFAAKITTIAISIFIMGCASVSTVMKHPDGRSVNCSASGFGIIGAPAALGMRADCIRKYKELGYIEQN